MYFLQSFGYRGQPIIKMYQITIQGGNYLCQLIMEILILI